MQKKETLYNNNASVVFFFGMFTIWTAMGVFLLGLVAFFGAFFLAMLLLMLYKLSYVYYIDTQLHIFSRFFIPKKIPFGQMTQVRCEFVGKLKPSRYVYVYYQDGDTVKKSLLLHFRFLGKRPIVDFLNKIDIEKIDVDSFKKYYIEYKNGKFKSSLWW